MTTEIPRPVRLLEQVEWACRRRYYSPKTAKSYVYWARRFILFHGKRHPRELGQREVRGFLDALVEQNAAPMTHSQALNALVFLYREVLATPFDWLVGLERPKRRKRLPVVLSAAEVAQVLSAMKGMPGLMARLIYGSGLRVQECVELRVKDLQWPHYAILVRSGKGGKDRTTLLPRQLVSELRAQVTAVAQIHKSRELRGGGFAAMPGRL